MTRTGKAVRHHHRSMSRSPIRPPPSSSSGCCRTGGRGEQITTTFELEPNSETEVIVEIDDPDGDENFVLELTGGGGGIAEFVPRLSLVAGVPPSHQHTDLDRGS